MNAIADLTHEHDVVKQTLLILTQIGDRAERENTLQAGHPEQLFEFLRVFVDRCHHSKEEDILFPMLEQHGGAQAAPMIAQMLTEHQQGRDFVRRMEQAVAKYRSGNTAAISQFNEAARGYVELLRSHIDKEDTIVYAIAERIMTEDRQSALLEAFERIERERIGAGKHEEFHRLIHQLTQFYAA